MEDYVAKHSAVAFILCVALLFARVGTWQGKLGGGGGGGGIHIITLLVGEKLCRII